MTTIDTKYGPLPLEDVLITTGIDSSDDADCEWREVHLKDGGELVRRDVHVTIKRGLEMFPEQASFRS